MLGAAFGLAVPETERENEWMGETRDSLVDRGNAVDLEVFDSPEKATQAHRSGLRRLFMLQLREQAKYVEKGLPGLQTMALQSVGWADAADLKAQLLAAAFERACMAEPLPRNANGKVLKRQLRELVGS